MILRPATADDFTFLTEMLLEANNWDGESWFTLDKLRAEDSAWRYVAGWPRATDFGVVAEVDGALAGATWARQLTADHPGYGYIADDVPELTLGAPNEGQGLAPVHVRHTAARTPSGDLEQVTTCPRSPRLVRGSTSHSAGA
ncbi:hypothetical protein [Kribbella sp. NBC_00889]|uniref:hypothetical protein n=1 Tax=Kribbella sp. NBC_00889 TaxID=2975974 RepID=UPI00386F0234|nr:hypothetical protein OG817_15410 [Kribbella sp. NBC_00889]